MRAMAAILALAAAAVATVPVNTESRKIALVGDWGGQDSAPYYNPPEQATAEALATYAKANPLSTCLLLGDNFYSSGIHGDDHSIRFKDTFEDVFNGESLTDIPFYAVLGNHDYGGNVTAEVAYTSLSTRWSMPETYYAETLSYKGTDGSTFTVQLVAIDTVVLAGQTSGEDPTEQPAGPLDEAAADSQWDWIKDTLENATADFVFVYGHYPVISGCSHGPTAVLDMRLQPMLEQYGAHYFSGHDHCQEYAVWKNVSYVLSGVGHGCCYSWSNEDKNPKGSILWHHASDNAVSDSDVPDAGFAIIDLDTDGFTATYYNGELTKQYESAKIPPRAPALIDAAKARN